MSLAKLGMAFGVVALFAPLDVWSGESAPREAGASRWTQLVASPASDEYIDLSSIETTGMERRVETLTDLKEPAPADGALRPYFSRTVERVIDCAGRRVRVLRMVHYGNPMAVMEVDRLDFTKAALSDWKALPADPDSIGDMYIQAVCHPEVWNSRNTVWTPVALKSGGVQVSFAASSEAGGSSPLRVRALVVLDKPRSQPGRSSSAYQSVVMTADADCAGGTMRALAVAYYSAPNPEGMLPTVMNTRVPHEWRTLSDKGAFDVAVQSACSRQSPVVPASGG